jgi:hypothetical protein
MFKNQLKQYYMLTNITEDNLKQLLSEYLSSEYDEAEVKEQIEGCKIEVTDPDKNLVKITYDNEVYEFVEIKYKPYFCNENTEDM